MMGGGWCESIESCTSRAFSERCYVGSSNTSCFLNEPLSNRLPGNLSAFKPLMNITAIPSLIGARWAGGPAMTDPSTNPLTASWNYVEISYCSGGSFSGNNASTTSVVVNGEKRDLHFRGGRNLDAVIDDLSKRHGLDAATRVIVTGASAGGLATYWHTDRLAARLSQAFVVGVPDSGFFLAVRDLDPGWPTRLQWIAEYMNSTAYLNQACVGAALRRGASPAAACTLPEDVAPFMVSPVFAMNSRFDPALDSISAGISGGDTAKVNRVGGLVADGINRTVLGTSPLNAAFVTACHEHCGQWSQHQVLGAGGKLDDFFVRTPDGTTAPFALNAWYGAVEGVWRRWRQGRPAGESAFASTTALVAALRTDTSLLAQVQAAVGRRWYEQPSSYPCDTCCSGGTR